MIQMQVVSSCAPIPAVINGVDQSQFGREFVLNVPSPNNKKQKPRTVDAEDSGIVYLSDGVGGQKKVPSVAIFVHGKRLLYPKNCFSSISRPVLSSLTPMFQQ